MSLELLQSIQEAESRAETERSNAQREAREIIKGVTDACTEDERSAAAENRALFQSMLDDTKAKVEQRLKQNASGREKDREEMMNTAGKRLSAAADRIIERVLNDGHR